MRAAAILFQPLGHAENALGARQAIPNWPRGKSTTAAWSNARWEYVEVDWSWPIARTDEFHLDLLHDALYHKEQKQMVDRWLANYRDGYYKQSTIFSNLR